MRKAGTAVQHTLKASIHCRGIGLHSGVSATIVLNPAPVDSGIVFRRHDIANGPVEIPALWNNVVESTLCTMLSDGKDCTISTVEHLMAALNGCAIDNAVIDIWGPEVPIMDGSAAPFVFLIECAGILPQTAPRHAIRVLKTIRVGSGERWGEIAPDDLPSVACSIDFASKAIARQATDIVIDHHSFKTEISRARTFGFLHEVDGLRAAGKALGGSLENVVVVDGDRVLNEDGLRYSDEFARHKALDAIGDLYLAGAPLLGRFRASRPSHAMSRQLLEALFSDPEAWALETLDGAERSVAPLRHWEAAEALTA
jgi:UDP-3-O-[3-hydroxymyristoyl] N-acetylglucosamine deacetylase